MRSGSGSQRREGICSQTLIIRARLVGVLLLALAALAGCGEVDSTNSELTGIHTTGPNCAQSACHAGFTLSGTLYQNIAGTARVPGEVLWVIPPSGPSVGIVSDGQANVWSLTDYQGDYQFRVGAAGPTSGLHSMPDRYDCNRCHVPVVDGGDGRMF